MDPHVKIIYAIGAILLVGAILAGVAAYLGATS